MVQVIVPVLLVGALIVGLLNVWWNKRRWETPSAGLGRITPRAVRAGVMALAIVTGIVIGNASTQGVVVVSTTTVLMCGIGLLLMYLFVDYARNHWHWFVAAFESGSGLISKNSLYLVTGLALAYGMMVGFWLTKFAKLQDFFLS